METWLDALAATSIAQWVAYSRWGYAVINTAHVFGIALLVGSIIPLDLKLLGLWRRVEVTSLAQVLVPVAIIGLVLAALSGFLLFLAGPSDYASLNIFLIKILLIVIGVTNAVHFHWRIGYTASKNTLRLIGGLSLLLWVCVLVAGRLVAYS